MNEDIDSAIAAKQSELDALKLEMETVRVQFIKESSVFIAGWYNETANQYVISHSDVTIKIGKERLAEMKAKVKELVDSAEKIAAETLSDPNLWWNLNPKDADVISPYEQYGRRIPEIIDKPIRRAFGRLGIVLEEYGYGVSTKPVYTGGTAPFGWYEYPSTTTYPPPSPVPYYPYALDWSKEMQETMSRYNAIYKKAYAAYSEIKRLQRSKQDKQASDLWNSA